MTLKDKKSVLQHGDTHDKLNVSYYAQAIASLESFRQQHRYGIYIFRGQNHRIVSAEGQPKILGSCRGQTLVKESTFFLRWG